MAKRGRKVGAVSFCKITLEELNRILKPTAQVIVSIRYAEMIGLSGTRIVADTNTVSTLASTVSVDVQVEEFDEGEEIEGEGVAASYSDGFSGVKPVIQVEDFN